MTDYKIIQTINGPEDVKKLSMEQLEELASEIREALFNRLTKIGGHFGPNFGMVEAEIAMHYVFSSPKDKFIFIMCGAGGYANFTKQMLVSLGWDKSKIYNVGGYWNYEGKNAISTKIDGSDKCDFSKVLYHNIDFDNLTKIK